MYKTADRLRVRAGRMVKTGKTRKQELETDSSKGKKLLGLINKTNWQQTENTGINTLGIMWKMGNAWRGWKEAQRQV
jgi:hypothetical protein